MLEILRFISQVRTGCWTSWTLAIKNRGYRAFVYRNPVPHRWIWRYVYYRKKKIFLLYSCRVCNLLFVFYNWSSTDFYLILSASVDYDIEETRFREFVVCPFPGYGKFQSSLAIKATQCRRFYSLCWHTFILPVKRWHRRSFVRRDKCLCSLNHVLLSCDSRRLTICVLKFTSTCAPERRKYYGYGNCRCLY